MHLVSNVVGDDWISKRIRAGAMRALGAHIGPGSALHGGSYFTIPSHLVVGTNCFINRSCYFDLQAQVTIGDEVTIGHGTTIITSHHRLGPSRRRAGDVIDDPVVIKDGAWLGANVTVMPGVTIGRGALVGAGGGRHPRRLRRHMRRRRARPSDPSAAHGGRGRGARGCRPTCCGARTPHFDPAEHQLTAYAVVAAARSVV